MNEAHIRAILEFNETAKQLNSLEDQVQKLKDQVQEFKTAAHQLNSIELPSYIPSKVAVTNVKRYDVSRWFTVYLFVLVLISAFLVIVFWFGFNTVLKYKKIAEIEKKAYAKGHKDGANWMRNGLIKEMPENSSNWIRKYTKEQ